MKHVTVRKIEGRIQLTVRRGKRRKQLPDDLKARRGYWKMKLEALDLTEWRIRFRRCNGPIEKADYKMMNDVIL